MRPGADTTITIYQKQLEPRAMLLAMRTLHDQLNCTRNNTSSSCNLLGYLVNEILTIHWKASRHNLKLIYFQKRNFQHVKSVPYTQEENTERWQNVIPVASSYLCIYIPALSQPPRPNTHPTSVGPLDLCPTSASGEGRLSSPASQPSCPPGALSAPWDLRHAPLLIF